MSNEIQTVLIVDDDAEILSLLRTELGEEFHVFSAPNGEEGLILSLIHKPDIIVSDIQMPELNGWDFCYILRQIPSTRNIPFVFLSKLTDLPERIRSLRVGADDFIAKPFSLGEITHRIRAVGDRVWTRSRFLDGHTIFGNQINSVLIDLLDFLRTPDAPVMWNFPVFMIEEGSAFLTEILSGRYWTRSQERRQSNKC
jgi:DNA-binding response OmpR family regulator